MSNEINQSFYWMESAGDRFVLFGGDTHAYLAWFVRRRRYGADREDQVYLTPSLGLDGGKLSVS